MLGVGLVALALFSRLVLREALTPVMLAGMLAIVVGVSLLVSGGQASGAALTQPGAVRLALAPPTLILLAVLVACSVLPGLVSSRLQWRGAAPLFGIASGSAASIGVIFSKLMVAGFTDHAAGATLADNLGRPSFWIFVLLLTAGNGGSMVLQQIGFQKGSAVVLAPVFAVTCVAFPALAGAVLFGEWTGLAQSAIVLRLTGLLVIAAGVVALVVGEARARSSCVTESPYVR
jgi:drug/metabolite transporter (DMT)-like permease